MTDPGDPDVAAMLRFQAGDGSAFEELVLRHQKNVLNLVYRYLGDAVQAEDVSQEAFLRVYRARSSYSPTAKFSTWLYRITVNLCLNQIRSRRTTGALPEIASGEAPGADLDRVELQKAVKDAVDGLPENQRMAVLLARFEELSYEEICKVMDLSLEAVKSLLHRAKETLKEKLGPYVKR